jgi:hypothetical protein
MTKDSLSDLPGASLPVRRRYCFEYHFEIYFRREDELMEKTYKIRVGWLRLMYSVTIIIAGCSGIAILIIPDATKWMFGAACPHFISGIIGSVYLAFALLSVLGLRSPLKFAPVILMQMIYKTVWLFGVVVPLYVNGEITADMIPVIVIFTLVIIGDLIAIPFAWIIEGIFSKSSAKH